MLKTQTISENLIECARIYVNQRNRSDFHIECLFCCEVFDYFLNFMMHIGSRHENLYKSHDSDKHSANYHFDKCNDLRIEKEDETSTTVERHAATEAQDNNEVELEICLEEETVAAASFDSDDDDVAVSNAEKNVPQQRVRIFFSLRDTNPEVMIDFIEIIRKHPCHWNPNDANYLIKDKRDESAAAISKLLLERWQITATAVETRNSILHLCRWFEREYMRSLKHGEQGRMSFNCVHPDYYRRLLSFMPTDHLKWLECVECQRHFKTEASLLAHKHFAHNGERPYKCAFCPRTFVHVSTYRHHENRHTKVRTWPCDLCAYRGVTKTDHMLHMKTHTDVRNYVCGRCGAAYKSSTSLNVHKRTHAPPQLACHVCGRKFYENYRLKFHMQQRHRPSTHGAKDKLECNIRKKDFQQQHQHHHSIAIERIGSEPAIVSEEIYLDVETLDDNDANYVPTNDNCNVDHDDDDDDVYENVELLEDCSNESELA